MFYQIISKYPEILEKRSKEELYHIEKNKNFKKAKQLKNNIHIENLNKSRSIILKILDKGGVTLIIRGDRLITTYNTNIKLKRKRKYKGKK